MGNAKLTKAVKKIERTLPTSTHAFGGSPFQASGFTGDYDFTLFQHVMWPYAQNIVCKRSL